jgi:hypothetical protein
MAFLCHLCAIHKQTCSCVVSVSFLKCPIFAGEGFIERDIDKDRETGKACVFLSGVCVSVCMRVRMFMLLCVCTCVCHVFHVQEIRPTCSWVVFASSLTSPIVHKGRVAHTLALFCIHLVPIGSTLNCSLKQASAPYTRSRTHMLLGCLCFIFDLAHGSQRKVCTLLRYIP